MHLKMVIVQVTLLTIIEDMRYVCPDYREGNQTKKRKICSPAGLVEDDIV